MSKTIYASVFSGFVICLTKISYHIIMIFELFHDDPIDRPKYLSLYYFLS